MPTSYRAMPEPASYPDQESNVSGAIGTPGEFAMTEGGVESTLNAIDFETSE